MKFVEYNCWPDIDKTKPGWGLLKPGLPIGTILYLKHYYPIQGGWGLSTGATLQHIFLLQSDYRLKNEGGIWQGCYKYLVLATMKYTGEQIKIPWKIYEPSIENLYTVLLPE